MGEVVRLRFDSRLARFGCGMPQSIDGVGVVRCVRVDPWDTVVLAVFELENGSKILASTPKGETSWRSVATNQ